MTPIRPVSSGGRVALLLRATHAVVVLSAGALVAIYLAIAARTLAYPYPLEWMEGGSVDVIGRVLAHLPIYTAPSADYVPYIYTPLYYVVGALAARCLHLDFLAARLVSFVAICGASAIVWRFIRREGGSRVAALAGVGLLAAAYDTVDRAFHLARVDSLFLLLLLAAFYAFRFWRGLRGALASGVLFWLAFLTKQTTLMVAAVALSVIAVSETRRAAIAALVCAALVLGTTIVMDARSGGWWSYFVFRLPTLQPLDARMWRWFWRYDMGPGRAIPLAGAALLVVVAARRDRWGAAFYPGLLAGCIGASWLSRVHSGGAPNVLLPAMASLSIALPLAVETLRGRGVLQLGGWVALAAQLVMGLHVPLHAVPTAADRAAGDELVRFLRGIDGDVMVWHQRFVETRAGKRSWGLEMAAEDVLRSSDDATAEALKADIIRAARARRFVGVMDPPDWLREAVVFGAPTDVFVDPGVFRPVAGAPKRPLEYFPLAPPLR